MRFRSQPTDGYVIHAVSGINTISFAIDATGANTAGLLGFAVERVDPAASEQYFMYGFKVFRSVIPVPTKEMVVSTRDHPIQSFVWDDFTAKPAHTYTYRFHPLKGKPKNIDRSAAAISIEVRTEPLFTNGPHDVFFNRGVASSQAYERRFGNQRPIILPRSGVRFMVPTKRNWFNTPMGTVGVPVDFYLENTAMPISELLPLLEKLERGRP